MKLHDASMMLAFGRQLSDILEACVAKEAEMKR